MQPLGTRSYGSSSHNCRGPFYQHGLTLIASLISKQMLSKMWGEIDYPFPNFNDVTLKVWEWVNNFILHVRMDIITYPF